VPWQNYLGNEEIFSIITQVGGGSIAVQNRSGCNQSVLRSSLSSLDTPSRIIYLRDNDSGRFWAINYGLNGQQFDRFEARHGAGYSVIETSIEGIDAALKIFVPTNGAVEIWQLQLKNQTAAKRRLSVFALAQWSPTSSPNTAETFFYNNTALSSDRADTNEERAFFFLTTDHPHHSFDTQRQKFLGPYGSFERPLAVVDGKCSRSLGSGEEPIGVVQGNITLGPKAQSQWHIFTGAVFAPKGKTTARQVSAQVNQLLGPFRRAGAIEEAWQAVTTGYKEVLATSQLASPEPTTNRYYNYFMRYQLLARRAWPTLGDGWQMKDVAASVKALAIMQPRAALELLKEACRHQHQDGVVSTSWSNGENIFEPDQEVNDCLSLAEAIIAYVKETGDTSVLSQSVPYLEGTAATIIEHLTRLIDYCLRGLSAQHLIEIRDQERTAPTAQLIWLLRNFLPLLTKLNDTALEKRYLRLIKEMTTSLNTRLYEGPYYVRARQNGRKISLKTAGGWDLASQNWAVISGTADQKKTERILKKIGQDFKAGVPNIAPSYLEPDPTEPIHSFEHPGLGNNGSVWTELVLGAVWAATTIGDGDTAWQLFKSVCAPYLAQKSDRYQQAPLLQAETISLMTSNYGQADLGERPSSAMSQILLERILGIQPTLHGLQVDPCLPRDWRLVEVSRTFRQAEYHFRIQNPFRLSKGIDRIVVDGIRLTGNVIRPFSGGSHFIEVILG